MKSPEEFISHFLKLAGVLHVLSSHNLDWMIAGSGCLWFYGNKRMPNDVDLFLRDEQHDLADKLFDVTSFEYVSPLERVRNSNPFGEHEMQLTSHLRISVAKKTYNLSMGDDVFSKRAKGESSIGPLWLMPPEDALLIKALLQRGPDVGKHDVEDIQNLLEIYNPDKAYLKKRIEDLGAEERVGTIFC